MRTLTNTIGSTHRKGFLLLLALIVTLFTSQAEAARKSTYTKLTLKSQPADTILKTGDSFSFSVTALSSRKITYTWTKDGIKFGTNSRSFSLSNASSADSGVYSCIVSDRITTLTCNPFKVSVTSPAPTSDLKLNTQPANTTIYEGGNAIFSMAISSSAPVTYSWFKEGTVIGIGSSLSITNTKLNSAGTYSCQVTDSIVTIACKPFTLTINQVVRISQQPISQIIDEGTSTSMNIVATGTAPISYQWYYNGSTINGATSNSLTIANAVTTNSGDYYCRVSNPGSTENSTSAKLTVVAVAKTGSAIISWAAPSKRTDGSALSMNEIEGYELYYSADGANNLSRLTTLPASELSIVIDDLSPGVHYFALATLDVYGIQSDRSATFSVTIE